MAKDTALINGGPGEWRPGMPAPIFNLAFPAPSSPDLDRKEAGTEWAE